MFNPQSDHHGARFRESKILEDMKPLAIGLIAALIVLTGKLVHGQPQSINSVSRDGLSRLPYNHPGLVVDLGVGLWAWPLPCDADGDGDFDLIVSCPDKPSNGIWLFENATGDTARHKLPTFRPARRLSSTIHYVMPSYVDGSLRVLTP